jgi:hypothetical protein
MYQVYACCMMEWKTNFNFKCKKWVVVTRLLGDINQWRSLVIAPAVHAQHH